MIPSGHGPLGVLAGAGPLPGQVARAATEAGRGVFILGFSDYAEAEVIERFPHAYARLGAAGRILSLLREHRCRDIVLVGPVRRPSLLDLRPDAEGARILGRLGRAMFSGDDGLLAAIVRVFGEEGFRVLGAHEVLPEATVPAGVLSRASPDAEALSDIARAVAVLGAIGAQDIGQGCIVQLGVVLAVEAVEGTDRMLQRAAALALPGPGGVLVKMVKPQQDRRADLPTIGPRTIEAAAAAGLRGVAVEAGGTLATDLPACIAAADRLGLFLMGVASDLPVTPGGSAA